jgi:peptidoglycan/xylan/chitin deacetylase (PgdA/CDA1 family)
LNLKNKIVITFDDGYLDNFENALPILKKYNCPAIIYIVTSFLDNKNYPWWLKIWKMIEVNDYIIYDQKKIDIANKSSKIKIYNFFCEKIVMMKQFEQNSFFNNIAKNLNNYEIEKTNDFLSKNDLINLSKSEFIEIGCHTHYHQNLEILNDDELYDEISKSKLILEQILDKEINHFSIPFGTTNRFSKRSLELLKKFNFKTIVTTESGNFRINKILRIPRIGIGNNDLNDTLYSKALGFDSFINQILNR